MTIPTKRTDCGVISAPIILVIFLVTDSMLVFSVEVLTNYRRFGYVLLRPVNGGSAEMTTITIIAVLIF